MQLAARTGAWRPSGAPLSYDAEVEYVKSDGNQYIDTKVNVFDGISAFVSFAPSNGAFVFGSEVAWGNNAFGLVLRTTGSHSVEYGSAVTIDGGWSTNRVDAYVSKFGATYDEKSIAYTKSLNESDYTIFVFASNRGGSVNQKIKMSLFEFVLKNADGKEIMNLIPVRFTNENGETEGAMYDRVSGQLFRNKGTGAFVIGPDVVSTRGGGVLNA